MGIRALCAAAAVVAGVGAADAAPVRYVLQFEDTAYEDLKIWDADGPTDPNKPDYAFDSLSIYDSMWRLTRLFWNAEVGHHYNGYSVIRNGTAVSCVVFSFDCGTRGVAAEVFGPLDIITDTFSLSRDGSKVTLRVTETGWSNGPGFSYPRDGWLIEATAITATFTIISEEVGLSEVPLPATAALLPMGLGALAMMRRRRRS